MKIKSKTVALLVALGLVSTISACGTSPQTGEEGTDTGTTTTETSTDTEGEQSP